MSANRLTIACLHARIGRRRLVVVIVAQAPGPVNRAGTEDQRTARRTVKRQIVRCGADAGRVAVVEQIGVDRQASSRRAAPGRRDRKPLSGASSHS